MEMGIRSNYVLCAIVGTIARPSTTFRTMFHAPDGYRASSVAIFATVCLVSALPSTSVWLESDSGTSNGFGNDVRAYAKSLISTVLQNFMIIAAIFWVGTRYGEKLKFRDMFPVLSYCLIPIAVGAAATLIGMHLFDPLAFMHDDIQDADAGVSPSYALNFTGGTIIYMAQGAFALFFMAWAGGVISKGDKDITWVWNRQDRWRFGVGNSSHICVYDSIWNFTDAFFGTGMARSAGAGRCHKQLLSYQHNVLEITQNHVC